MSTTWPAAHSMDTTWFAVDADGLVGVFDSGEDGAVPEKAASGGGAGDPSFDTFPLDAARLACAIAASPSYLVEWSSGLDNLDAKKTGPMRVVVVLKDPRLVQGAGSHRTSPTALQTIEEQVPDAEWKVVRNAEPRVLLSARKLALSALRDIEARSDLEAVVHESALWEALDRDGPDGLFHFGHQSAEDDYGPGRYELAGEPPKEPLEISALPLKEQERVGGLRLPIRFAETKHLQLADFMDDKDCHFWAANMSLRGERLDAENPRVPAKSGLARQGKIRSVIVLVVAFVVILLLWLVRRR